MMIQHQLVGRTAHTPVQRLLLQDAAVVVRCEAYRVLLAAYFARMDLPLEEVRQFVADPVA